MERWHYLGDVDLFGLTDSEAEATLVAVAAEADATGGEMQVQRLGNQIDTKRYRISLYWSSLATPLPRLLGELLRRLPEDHPRMVLRGYDHGNGQREDLVLHDRRVWIVPYEWTPSAAVEYPLGEPSGRVALTT